MSPDERFVVRFIDRAVSRARGIAIARLLGWAFAGAAVGAEVAMLAKIHVIPAMAAAALSAALLRVKRPLASRPAVLTQIEHAEPAYRNLLVTAEELRPNTDVSETVRARVFADAAALSRRVDMTRAIPMVGILRVVLIACAVWTIVAATTLVARSSASVKATNSAKSRSHPQHVPLLRVTAKITPPAYTGEAPITAIDPPELRAIEGSDLMLQIDGAADHAAVTHDGTARALGRDSSGRFVDHEMLERTGYLVVEAAGSRRTIPVVVTPDALPAVRITAPGRDLIFSGGNPRLSFEAQATDDFGVRSLQLRYTKVSGSGEQFEFAEGEIPLSIDRLSPREWRGSAGRALSDLHLKDGDMLVYRAQASDARPGVRVAISDAFFIEMSNLGVAAGDSFTLPQEETRYALSEEMLILKTQQLAERRASLAAGDFAEAAVDLGVEQRMVRAEFVFMLGGEVEDEEVEAEQSTELQEGRLRNHGQSDLRAATIAMSQAEKYLTAANTTEALKAERAAVAALQRAFAHDRYILRALATRSQLDLSRRLTGTLSGASDWHRRQVDRPEDRRAAQLQSLLRGIAALIADADMDQSAARARAGVLAEQAVRTDASSTVLRDAATALQQTAEHWAAVDRARRTRELTAISAGVAAETRRTLASAAPFNGEVPSLRGAFVDRLSARPRTP